MARFDLSDAEWAIIAPLLPNKPRGVPRRDDRRVLNGIFYILRTGSTATPVRCARLHRPGALAEARWSLHATTHDPNGGSNDGV